MSHTRTDLQTRIDPVLDDIAERARVTEHFVDKDVYRILLTTLWANLVLDPEDAGLGVDDLEPLHDLINARSRDVLGADGDLKSCFRYLNSKPGEQAMSAVRLTEQHKQLLLYFSSIILDPDGHRRWMEGLNDPRAR